MLSELKVEWAAKKDAAKPQAIGLTNAQADYNQAGWHVSGAIDGDPATGWALDGAEGKNHVAVFECKEPFGHVGGAVLTFHLDQQFGDGNHELGKFRLSVTNSPRPIQLMGPPENIARILAVPAEKRTPAETNELADYFRSQDAELARLNGAVAQHLNDRSNARLLGAQDLAWALLNSPAFLFNR